MSDMVEKIYCCDKGSNNDALYALLANQRNDNSPFMASMMNNGMGGQWNNPLK